MPTQRRCSNCGENRYEDDFCACCLRCRPREADVRRCCGCLKCPTCAEYFRNDQRCPVGACHKCPNCCECAMEGGIRFVKQPKEPFWESSFAKGQFKRNKSHRFCAAEIEVAGIKKNGGLNTNKAVKKWKASVVHDGSLPGGGFEINTAPANGDLMLQEITEFGDALAADGGFVTQSCGCHIHIDARDFTYYELRKLLLLYPRLEESLFSMVPANRRSSHYCAKTQNTFCKGLNEHKLPWASKAQIIQNLYGHLGDVSFHRRDKGNSKRYSAFNLHSWFHRGTIECRLFGGTTQAPKILNWMQLWCGILDGAKKWKEADIVALPPTWETIARFAPTPQVLEWMIDRREMFNRSIGAYSVEPEQAERVA